jgi:NAD(P)H-nitrite reductase large subunit
MGKKAAPLDRTICFCYSITESQIVAAIQNGAESLMEIRRVTYANTGCGGCGEEVKKLLRKHAKQEPPAGET